MKKAYPEPFRRVRKTEDGSREAKVYSFTIETGGRRRILSTGETTKEKARAFIRQYVDRRSGRSGDGGGVAFRDYSASYFVWEEGERPECPHARRLVDGGETIGRQHCLASRRLLDRLLEKYPDFGDLVMGEIRRKQIVNLRSDLAADFPPRTAGLMLEAVKTVLSEAVFLEDIPSNPGALIGKPKYEQRERGAFTVAEVRALLAFLHGHTARSKAEAASARPVKPGAKAARASLVALQAARDEALLVFMFGVGVRAAEARATRWRALDLETREGRIVEAAKGESGQETGLPKWDKTRRVVLPVFVAEALKAWKAEALYTKPDDFIFAGPDGRLPSHEQVKKAFAHLLEKAVETPEPILKIGDRWLTPHSARHTLNSALLASGASPLAVSEFLGWSSDAGRVLAKVQQVYTHLAVLDLRKVADEIDELYGEGARNQRIKLSS